MIHATCGSPRRNTKSVRMPPASEAKEMPQRRSHRSAGAHPGGPEPLGDATRDLVAAQRLETSMTSRPALRR